MNITYRPEIDGLRTLAVFSVIIYHAEFLLSGSVLFPAGFLGVDVFFVISGYLISKIILRESIAQEFSYLDFYKRRARRILPVLLVVFAVSTYFAWVNMLPKAMMEYSGSLLSSLGFGSNIWFWLENSYTAEASELKPLLHTWSLSLEEQFYIVFPPLIFVAYKYFKAYLLHITCLLILASLVLAEYSSYKNPDAGFYLLPARGWELLAGTFLALIEPAKKTADRYSLLEKCLPLLGVALIIGSFSVLNDDVRHPSFYTLIPVIGTMLAIHFATPSDWAIKLLSSKLFVKTGLISYSLYLWHVPIFAFSKIQNSDRVNADMVKLTALSFGLSLLTYFLIEKPFRNPNKVKDVVFYPVVGIFFTGLVVINIYSLTNDGIPERLDDYGIQILYGLSGQLATKDQRGLPCHERPHSNHCTLNASGTNGTYVLIGDSKAASISSAVLHVAKDNNARFVQLTRGSCPYMPGTRWTIKKDLDDCSIRSADVPRVVEQLEKPVTIFYHSRTAKWMNRGRFFPTQEGEDVDASITQAFNRYLADGYRIVLVYPAPEPDEHIPKRVQRELTAMKEAPAQGTKLQALDLSTSYVKFKQHIEKTKKVFDGIGMDKNPIRIYPDDVFCSDSTNKCLTHDGHKLYYMDGHHISIHGASLLYPLIKKKLAAADVLEVPERDN
ncbi:O-acetyltransferase OatA [BD1-7 clade bacterium]|uniref:O-acetyltransferase OatA n=1 Tax=BD1-7 clade bacterium TaxID=2029982 RepID=A0A5S9QAQ6_9GAMM|nr:O-acetyltransferase OatA [BD1-7 clade bacterium]CAA0114499.1 O-acetyltransferase OatA [BD1-7 clade bacterium]